ncbi:sugar glycosyltransferase [Mixta hanseatica]|uniref:Sugar glycosyltransferase n=1 Tax=Mixta hanseatica TaxID=2872648 RepID=A0ABY4RBE2_9GAMM|nr:sugar glycosyltransferase [Mixta hanseatica]UQY44020.1 sugar glycosyltransferase [Mixta hanseatica]
MGTFFKQIYRYTHPRRYRHNENLWPYIKISRAEQGHIDSLRYRGQPVPLYNLSLLRDERPEKLLIVATGPSVNHTDFSVLQQLPAMGLNGAWFKHQEIDFHYYVIVDMTFLDRHMDMVKEVVSQSELIFFTTMHGILKIIDAISLAQIKCRLALIEDACFKIMQPRIFPEEIPDQYKEMDAVHLDARHRHIAFSQDIRTGIFDAGTVAFWSLQIAGFMQPKKIIFAGLDMNNFNNPRFYETKQTMLPSFLEEKFTSIVLPAFQLASTVLAKKNISVYNLSAISAIPDNIFHKVSPDDVVSS